MTAIVLESANRDIKDSDDNLLFTASIYDLSLHIGSIINSFDATPDGTGAIASRLELFQKVADGLNQAFILGPARAKQVSDQHKANEPNDTTLGVLPPEVRLLTAGAAMELTEKVEAEMLELKKKKS